MWMLQPSWTIDILALCPFLYPRYMCIDNCVKVASNMIVIYLKLQQRAQMASEYAKTYK